MNGPLKVGDLAIACTVPSGDLFVVRVTRLFGKGVYNTTIVARLSSLFGGVIGMWFLDGNYWSYRRITPHEYCTLAISRVLAGEYFQEVPGALSR